jgi:hypothetical protein
MHEGRVEELDVTKIILPPKQIFRKNSDKSAILIVWISLVPINDRRWMVPAANAYQSKRLRPKAAPPLFNGFSSKKVINASFGRLCLQPGAG